MFELKEPPILGFFEKFLHLKRFAKPFFEITGSVGARHGTGS
jgi:hypothetical protein